MPSDTSTEPSPLFGARMAGALWLIVILASILAVVGGASLDLRGDPATIAANALASAPRIRLAFVMLFFGKICYLGGTVLLYELLKPVNKSVALFGAFCGLAGLLSGAHGLNQLTALSLLEESRRATEPVASQLQGAVKIFLAPGFSGEDVFFGCQIASVGYLIARSSFLPRAIGVLLMLGGAGSSLIDDAKGYELVRQHRWPDGVRCPRCESASVTRHGRDDTRPPGPQTCQEGRDVAMINPAAV